MLEKMAGFNADKMYEDNPEVSKYQRIILSRKLQKKLNLKTEKRYVEKKIDAKKVEIDTVKNKEYRRNSSWRKGDKF